MSLGFDFGRRVHDNGRRTVQGQFLRPGEHSDCLALPAEGGKARDDKEDQRSKEESCKTKASRLEESSESEKEHWH